MKLKRLEETAEKKRMREEGKNTERPQKKAAAKAEKKESWEKSTRGKGKRKADEGESSCKRARLDTLCVLWKLPGR